MTESYDFTLLDPPFWTPGGWERVKPPEAYVNACKNEMWEAGLREQGYSVWYGWGEELDDYQAKVWANDRDGHLMISLWNCERETGVFFVYRRAGASPSSRTRPSWRMIWRWFERRWSHSCVTGRDERRRMARARAARAKTND